MRHQSPKETSLAAGYFWTFGATAIPLVSIFLSSLIIARWMGPRVAGLVSWTTALATMFLVVGKFGVDGAASKLASEYQVSAPRHIPKLIRSSVLLRLWFTVPTAVAATVLAPALADFFKEEALLPLFRLGGLLILAVSLNELSALLVIGLNRFRLLFVMRLAMFVLRVGLVLAAALAAMQASGVIGAFVAASLLPSLVVFLILFNIKPEDGSKPDKPPIMKRLLLLSAPLAISGASVTIYQLLDRLMLGYYEGATVVGIYSVARNVVETSLFPTFALIMTLRPVLASAYTSGDERRCSDIINRSIKNSIVYAAAVVVVFSCLSRPIIVGLFKEEFVSSAELLILFLPLIVMRSLGSTILPGLIAAERAGTYARLTLTGAILNFVLNILLIPVWKAKGAVISTLLSYIPIEVLGLKAVAGVIPGFWRRGDLSKILRVTFAAALIIVVYIKFIPKPVMILHTLIHASLITVVFSILLIAARVLTRDEIRGLLRPFLNLGRGVRKS